MDQKHLNMLFRAGRVFEPLYAGLMSMRSRLYSRGILKIHRPDIPVISIGNLSMGGTGKTPHVIACCRFLRKQGIKPAVVTRGYGGKAGKGPLVVSDGSDLFADAGTAGDEVFMMARMLDGVIIVAGSCRYQGAVTARQLGAEAIVLDDGFQHMALYRDRDVLLLPASEPFGNRHVFPGGDLREPISALKRATCILVTGCEQVSEGSVTLLREEIHSLVDNAPVFTSFNRIKGVCLVGEKDVYRPGTPEFEKWRKTPVLAFCGIGRPQSFTSILTRNGDGFGFNVKDTVSFKDHHVYNRNDIEALYKKAEELGASALVTTAKDAVKVMEYCRGIKGDGIQTASPIPILVLEVEAVPEDGFYRHVMQAICFT